MTFSECDLTKKTFVDIADSFLKESFSSLVLADGEEKYSLCINQLLSLSPLLLTHNDTLLLTNLVISNVIEANHMYSYAIDFINSFENRFVDQLILKYYYEDNLSLRQISQLFESNGITPFLEVAINRQRKRILLELDIPNWYARKLIVKI